MVDTIFPFTSFFATPYKIQCLLHVLSSPFTVQVRLAENMRARSSKQISNSPVTNTSRQTRCRPRRKHVWIPSPSSGSPITVLPNELLGIIFGSLRFIDFPSIIRTSKHFKVCTPELILDPKITANSLRGLWRSNTPKRLIQKSAIEYFYECDGFLRSSVTRSTKYMTLITILDAITYANSKYRLFMILVRRHRILLYVGKHTTNEIVYTLPSVRASLSTCCFG